MAMVSMGREAGYLGGRGILGTGSLWEEPAPIGSHSSAALGSWRVLLGISGGLVPLTTHIFGLGVFSGIDFTTGLNTWTSLSLVVSVFQRAGRSGSQQ